MHQARKCRLVSSGPLSHRMLYGLPRSLMICSSTRSAAGEAGISLERQAFASKSIDHSENTHRAAGCQYVGSKVQRPFLIRCHRHRRLHAGPHQAFTLATLHAQSRFAIHPPNTFVV